MKNTAKMLSLALGFILSWQTAGAKTVVISDIDDTIKISHVLDTWDMGLNAFRTGNLFLGMNTAYQELKAQDPTIEFFYVTNAPIDIMEGKHSTFLRTNDFPNHENMRLRESLGEKNHKVKAIAAILKQTNPNFVILLGDNGEADIDVFTSIVKDFPTIEFLTQVHTPYFSQSVEGQVGKPIKENQEAFATSFDMLLSWFDKGLINADKVADFMSKFTPALLKEPKNKKNGVLAFPEWVDCRDTSFDGTPITKLPEDMQNDAILTLSTIQDRCLIPAYDL
jgi:hypothetical protein